MSIIILCLVLWGIYKLLSKFGETVNMKTLLALFTIVLAWNMSSGFYEIDLKRGVFQFKSTDEIETSFADTNSFKQLDYSSRQLEKARQKQINAKTATDLTRIESDTNAPVDPNPVRFHSRNRLHNGQLMIVKRKVFGNSIKDGHRWMIYMYGVPDLGTFTNIMNNELNLDNKYRLINFGNKTKYVWAEVRSNFIVIK